MRLLVVEQVMDWAVVCAGRKEVIHTASSQGCRVLQLNARFLIITCLPGHTVTMYLYIGGTKLY
jgi:hypothetical protein